MVKRATRVLYFYHYLANKGLTFISNLLANLNMTGVAAQIETEQSPDSIIYINVLEHIEDDRLELEIIHRTLREKGRVFVFVPALPCFSVNLTNKSDIPDPTEKPNSRKQFAP